MQSKFDMKISVYIFLVSNLALIRALSTNLRGSNDNPIINEEDKETMIEKSFNEVESKENERSLWKDDFDISDFEYSPEHYGSWKVPSKKSRKYKKVKKEISKKKLKKGNSPRYYSKPKSRPKYKPKSSSKSSSSKRYDDHYHHYYYSSYSYSSPSKSSKSHTSKSHSKYDYPKYWGWRNMETSDEKIEDNSE